MSPMGKCGMGKCRFGYMSHGYMLPNQKSLKKGQLRPKISIDIEYKTQDLDRCRSHENVRHFNFRWKYIQGSYLTLKFYGSEFPFENEFGLLPWAMALPLFNSNILPIWGKSALWSQFWPLLSRFLTPWTWEKRAFSQNLILWFWNFLFLKYSIHKSEVPSWDIF